jgi:hypothetical protein
MITEYRNGGNFHDSMKTVDLSDNDVLKALKDGRVISFDLLGNSTLRVTEACDDYFWAELNKVEALRMIEQLQELVSKMG